MFRKPDNVVMGTLQGFKGGAMEVATGFAGIFSKPYEGAKEDGVAGFFKGVGKGLFGAVTSPVTAVLKIGTSFVQGIEGSVIKIGKGGISQQGRIRFPRYITPTNVLVSYDESLSEARLIINLLYEGKYASENILFFEVLKKRESKKEPMIIITEKRLLILTYKKKRKHKALHYDIEYGQLFSENNGGEVYTIRISLRNGKNFCFQTVCYSIAVRCIKFFPEKKAN